MNLYDFSLRYKKFLRDVLGDKFYYRMSNEFLLDLEKTLEGPFQEISSNDAIEVAANIFYVQPEQVTPEMRRMAREIRAVRNSRMEE